MNKNVLLICICLMAALLGIVVRADAQTPVFPVQVNASVIAGASVYLGDFANPLATANRLRFTLILRDPVELERRVYFRITLVQSGAVIGVSTPGFRGPEFTLQRNVPLQINGEDLAPYLNPNNISGLQGLNASGILTEGVNEVCLEVMDAFRSEPISNRICAVGYWARLQAPLLILPVESQFVFENQLNNTIFTWQMTDPLAQLPGANIDYLFELREQLPGLHPQDQFENHTLIYSSIEDKFSVFYNELSSQLEPGKSYLWRVTARFRDQNGLQIPEYFVNNGISRVGRFTVMNASIPGGPGGGGVSCACTGPDCLPNPPAITPRATPLTPGEVIQYGVFDLTVDEVTGSNSGKGSIQIPFLNKGVTLNFSNLSVNEDNRAYDGWVQADASTLLNGIQTTQDGVLEFVGLNPSQGDWLTSISQHLQQPLQAMSLPLSLGSKLASMGFAIPFEVLITGMYFSPSGMASFDLLMLIPDGNGSAYQFGVAGVAFGRNGFDLGGLKLFLLSDATLPGLAGTPVQLLRAVNGNPNAGSYVAFNCGGLETFNLQGRYVFPPTQIINALDPQAPAQASLTFNSTQWGQFLATASITPFEPANAPGWIITPSDAVFDLDLTRNADGMVFPASYGDPGNAWRGFYLSAMDVKMPDDIQLSKSGNAITFGGQHLLIDAQGVSCSLYGANILSLSTGSAGGWGFSMDTIQVNIALNNFIDAAIKGKVEVGLIDAQVQYAGLIQKDAQGAYVFNLSPQGSFEIPFIKLQVSILQGSALYLQRPGPGLSYRPFADFNLNVGVNIGESEFAAVGLGDLINNLKGVLGINTFDFGIGDLTFQNFRINHPDLPPGRWFGLGGVSGGTVNIPGLGGISLTDVHFFEKNTDFNGISLPGIGLDFGLGFGPIGFGVGVWGKEQNNPGGIGFPSFGFGKFELRTPNLSFLKFRCRCDAPPVSGEAPPTNFCADPSLANGTPVTLSEGDRIKVGHFDMVLDEVNGAAGVGKIEIPFMAKLLEVQFNQIAVHTMPSGEKRLVSGFVVSKPTSLLPQAVQDLATAEAPAVGPIDLSALPVTGAFMSEINNLAAGVGAFFSLPFSLRDKMQQFLGVEMPDDFDLVLLGLRFDAAKARASAMMTVKVGHERYLKFGIAGLNVRPDGLNMDGIQIYLAEDFSFGF